MIFDCSEFNVIGKYSYSTAVLAELIRKKPDIILVGIDEDHTAEAIDLLKNIKDDYPQIQLLVLTDNYDYDFLISLFRFGISGCISRNVRKFELHNSLLEVRKGGAPLARGVARKVVESFHRSSDTVLTKRESQVLFLLSQGNSSTQISRKLEIAFETSRSHIRNIYQKLKVNKRSDAVRYAIDNRLL